MFNEIRDVGQWPNSIPAYFCAQSARESYSGLGELKLKSPNTFWYL